MLVGALRVFPRTVLPRHRPKSSMRQTGADSPAPSQTVHWTVCVPLWRERAVRIPSLREKQKALSPDGERAFCGRSVIIGFQKTQIYQRFAGSQQEVIYSNKSSRCLNLYRQRELTSTSYSLAYTLHLPRIAAEVFRRRNRNSCTVIMCVAHFILARKRQNKFYILVKANFPSTTNNHIRGISFNHSFLCG